MAIYETFSRRQKKLSTQGESDPYRYDIFPQWLEEHLHTEQESEGRGVPIVPAFPVDRRMSVVALIGHFCVQREHFGEHVVGAPAESPGEGVAG